MGAASVVRIRSLLAERRNRAASACREEGVFLGSDSRRLLPDHAAEWTGTAEQVALASPVESPGHL